MSGITLRIDKGDSKAFHEIMGLLWNFPYIKECKNHISVRLTVEDMVFHAKSFSKIMRLLTTLEEEERFRIPAYGSDEWADWMIDLHSRKRPNK